jgi:hypothetical protein
MVIAFMAVAYLFLRPYLFNKLFMMMVEKMIFQSCHSEGRSERRIHILCGQGDKKYSFFF